MLIKAEHIWDKGRNIDRIVITIIGIINVECLLDVNSVCIKGRNLNEFAIGWSITNISQRIYLLFHMNSMYWMGIDVYIAHAIKH